MIDILEQIQLISRKNGLNLESQIDLENPSHHRRNSSVAEMMPDFQNQVLQAQSNLQKLNNNIEKIYQLKEEQSKTVVPNKHKEVSRKLERLLKENMGYSENIKGIINKLTTDVELSKKNDPNEPETTAKITNLRSLQTGLMELMSRNQQAQTDYKSNMKDRIGRQIGLLDENLSKEETNKLCNDPDGFQKLIAQKTLGAVPLELRYAVDDILDKYNDIKKLERSVEYVYQMFQDIALLVHNQGEELDNIETNLNNAKDYIEKAQNNLIKAKKEHQKSRKKMCIVLIVGLILLVVIIVPISLKTLNQI